MVVKLRLQRYGRKAAPFYKIVATDARKARDGKPIEYIGTYSPKIDKNGQKELRLHEGRVKYWLSVGAQPTETVSRLLGYAQILPPPPYTKKTKRHIPKADRGMTGMPGSSGGGNGVMGKGGGNGNKELGVANSASSMA